MANPVSPEKRRYRPFFIVCPPFLFLACIGGAFWVLLTAQNPFQALPLVAISVGPARMMRWSMLWLSTPKERELLGRKMEWEPLVEILKSWFRRRG
ncbi:MAG TPA: hypothetical protein VD866_12355 [Urbifossiella sp.]|nr:hypothetical protein [Urbifossiella sp.]